MLNLPGDHVPVDVLIEAGIALVTGHAIHPQTGLRSILTVGFNLDPNMPWIATDWTPFPVSSVYLDHVWFSIPDYDLEPVRWAEEAPSPAFSMMMA